MTSFSPKQIFVQTESFKRLEGGGKCWYWQQLKQKPHCFLFLRVNTGNKKEAVMFPLKKIIMIITVQRSTFPLPKENVSILGSQTTNFSPAQ